MKPLATKIKSKGFLYRQVWREGMKAVYSQARLNNPDKIIAHEAILVQSHNGYTLAGNTYPPAEFYPRTADWGSKAWTFTGSTSRQLALDRLSQVK